MFRSDIEILVVWWPPRTICLTLLSLNLAVEDFFLFKSDTEILVVWWPPSIICLTLLRVNLAVEDFFC